MCELLRRNPQLNGKEDNWNKLNDEKQRERERRERSSEGNGVLIKPPSSIINLQPMRGRRGEGGFLFLRQSNRLPNVSSELPDTNTSASKAKIANKFFVAVPPHYTPKCKWKRESVIMTPDNQAHVDPRSLWHTLGRTVMPKQSASP